MSGKTITHVAALQQRLADRSILARVRITRIIFNFANSSCKKTHLVSIISFNLAQKISFFYIPMQLHRSVLFSHFTRSVHSLISCTFCTILSCLSFSLTIWRPIFNFLIHPTNPALVPMFSKILFNIK